MQRNIINPPTVMIKVETCTLILSPNAITLSGSWQCVVGYDVKRLLHSSILEVRNQKKIVFLTALYNKHIIMCLLYTAT